MAPWPAAWARGLAASASEAGAEGDDGAEDGGLAAETTNSHEVPFWSPKRDAGLGRRTGVGQQKQSETSLAIAFSSESPLETGLEWDHLPIHGRVIRKRNQ